MLNISQVRIRKVMDEGNLKALASATVCEAIAIHELKIVQGANRLFVAMPSRVDESGCYRDIVHPINSEAREQLEEAVLRAYEAYLAEMEMEAAECNTN